MRTTTESEPPDVGSAVEAGAQALIVDDSATVRAYQRAILEQAGFSVLEAVNGYEGLELASAQQFDLLLVDVNMPVMDGYSLVEAVRGGMAWPEVPIIMISTEADPADAREAMRRGADLYLVKPADPAKLATAARLLTGHRPPKAGGAS